MSVPRLLSLVHMATARAFLCRLFVIWFSGDRCLGSWYIDQLQVGVPVLKRATDFTSVNIVQYMSFVERYFSTVSCIFWILLERGVARCPRSWLIVLVTEQFRFRSPSHPGKGPD